MGGREQVLDAVLDPLQCGVRHRDRHEAERHVLGVEHRLDAEPAPDVGRDHPDVALGQPEQLGELGADEVGHLGAGPEREAPVGALEAGDPGAALDGVAGVAVGGELPLDDDVRAGEGVGDVAGAEGAREQQVVGGLVVDGVGDVGGVGPRADGGAQRLVVDVHALGAVLGAVAVVGDDRGDGLAREPDLPAGQRRLLGLDVAGQRRLRAQRHGAHRRVLPGEHGVHALGPERLGGVDRSQPRVGDGAADERHVPHPGEHQVGDVAAPAGEQPRVLLAADGGAARAGGFGGRGPGGDRFGGHHGIANPPLTDRTCPVVHDEHGDASSRIVGVTSSGRPRRRSG